jgi:hypothetical protein
MVVLLSFRCENLVQKRIAVHEQRVGQRAFLGSASVIDA